MIATIRLGRWRVRHTVIASIILVLVQVANPHAVAAQNPTPLPRDTAGRAAPVLPRGDSVSVHLIDVDLRAAVQALAPYVDRPVIFGAVNAGRVTLESPRPIARGEVTRVLRGLVESQNLELRLDTASGTYRVQAKALPTPAAPPMPLAAGAASGPQQLFVVRLKHARAAEVAATVNALYGRASALGESTVMGARGAGPTLPQELNAPPPNAAPPVIAMASSGRGSNLSSETTIIPDESTNSLLVRGTKSDFELVQEAVQALDIRPLQVLIQVLIAEVRRNSQFALGIGGSVPSTTITGRTPLSGTTVSGSMGGGAVSDSTLGDFVLHLMRGGSGINFNASLTAAESRGEARVLSRPVLIAANNETAEILVGSQRPFIQMQRSLPTNVPERDQVVQYRDVGPRLTVRPTISADGYVVLAVTQEVNQATTEVQFDAPVISTRTVQTQLLVRDSQTVVLGGLADRERDNNRTGIPVLSRIPVIGGLFGGTQKQDAETEFFLFITPRIIRSDAEADSVTKPLQERARPDAPLLPDSLLQR